MHTADVFTVLLLSFWILFEKGVQVTILLWNIRKSGCSKGEAKGRKKASVFLGICKDQFILFGCHNFMMSYSQSLLSFSLALCHLSGYSYGRVS